MSVQDHGIEVLKKSGEEVTPGDKSDYYIKTGLLYNGQPVSNSNPLPTSATINGDVIIDGDSLVSGTTDGTATGTERTFVNNRLQQLLASHDLTKAFTWLDFGSKNERISTIVYSSVALAITATRTFSYTLVTSNYRLDSDVWSVTGGA